MKKMLLAVALLSIAGFASGCGSLRTPVEGKNKNVVYYMTFFGLSLESGAYGDGFILNGK
ncbi:MAG: hypothetical protein MJ016_06530 [Victivallaceae bacterium]|nr:hypothetical protein [Victivallaceae bacterium]